MHKTVQIVATCLVIALIVTAIMLYEQHYNNSQKIKLSEQPVNTQLRAELVPNINFTDTNGKSYKLHELDESIVFLHFWASWCVPCLAEIPDMLELVDKADGKLAIVAVSIDTDMKKLESFMKRLKKKHGNKVNNPHIYWVTDADKEISLKTFNIAKVPETIVINKERLMIKKIVGENDWLSAETKALIE